MKKSLFKNSVNKDTYYKIRKKRKWLKRRAFLLAAFVFGVNIYAWFVFIANANMDVDGSVVAWDVNFFDGATEVKDVVISEILYPGMPEFKKQISVVNSSDTAANFEYEIDSFTILGIDSINGKTQEELLTSMKNDYPFEIDVSVDKTHLGLNDSLVFTITMNWDYEEATKYYKLTNHYTFDPSVNYYTFNNGTYTVDSTVTDDTFPTRRLNLYLEKDDADSYFGEACANYESANGAACVRYRIELKVKQVS